MNGRDIQKRLTDFAVEIILVDQKTAEKNLWIEAGTIIHRL